MSVLDGADLARHIRQQIKGEVAALGKPVTLAVILVGDDPASQIYVRHKVQACAEVGVRSIRKEYRASSAQQEVRDCIRQLNEDPQIHGILIQLPLPENWPTQEILALVDPRKDVDGFHAVNLGRLVQDRPQLAPCTPLGIMELLHHYRIDLAGRAAVVVGRSTIVGKPMALMLLAEGATVTICHSRTQDLASHTRRADILVAAVGRANLITGDMVKPGAVVVDVGMNRNAAGKLQGDVDHATAAKVAAWITPVPGGVGPLTIALLLKNTLRAARSL